jgi:hypothetical protein
MMDDLLVAVSPILAGWLAGALFVALMGGFTLIRRVESSNVQIAKTPIYWLTLIILYPIILLRAAAKAMWEVMIGGTR